jgi:hypothetical protein
MTLVSFRDNSEPEQATFSLVTLIRNFIALLRCISSSVCWFFPTTGEHLCQKSKSRYRVGDLTRTWDGT